MKKKQRNIVIGIVLILALLITLNSQGVLKLPFVITGTNTLSLSQATLQSTNPYLSGKAWLLTFSSGGLGQKYFGLFGPSDVQSATSDSSTTTKDFSIDVTYADQICNYNIIQTNTVKPIYDIQSINWAYVPLINPCSVDEAKSRGISNVFYSIKPSLSLTCYAWGYNSQSPAGYLSSPNLESSYDIKVTTPSGTATKTINTLSGSSQGPVGNYAYVSWAGNLVSGLSCDSSSPYIPIYVNGIWRLGSKSAYDNYLSLLNSPQFSSDSAIKDYLIKLQNSISQAKVSQSFGSIQSSTSLSNAVVKITKSTQIQFPVTTLYIKASEIGIFTPAPDFNIISTDSQCFQTGTEGNIAVTIRNDGESGTGSVYAQCSSPFTSTSKTQFSLDNGQSKTIYLTLSASADKEIKSLCNVFVESPGGINSASANTCVKPQLTCQANTLFCSIANNQEVIRQCSSDGATSTIIQTCSINQYCGIEDGKPICITGTKSDGGFFSSLWNGIKGFFSGVFDFTGGILNIFRNVVVLIVGIFSFLFGVDLFQNFRAIRKYKWLPWILALIIAGALAYLVFTIFWVGLIIFGVFILLKQVLKFTPVGRFLR